MSTVNGCKADRRYKASKEHLFCELDGKAVILSLKTENYYGINAVGTFIWSLIQIPLSLSEIQSSILEEFDVDSETCHREVKDFLSKMSEEGLVEVIDAEDS